MFETTWQVVLFAYFIGGWFLRFAMLFIVPRDKPPASATAWLLLIWIEPVIGSIIFAMFGQPKLPIGRHRAQHKVDRLTKQELEELESSQPELFDQPADLSFKEIEKLSTALGGLPAMTGNKVRIFTDYEEILQVQTRAVDKAKDYVHVEFFIMALDDSTEPFFDSMERAVRRGVKVRVLIDRLAVMYYPRYKEMKKRLDSIGVDWHFMLPFNLKPGKSFTRPDLRNHRKVLIIDGVLAYSGSANIIQANYHRKDELIYEDLFLELKGPIVWQCNNVFRSDWYAETKEPLLEIVEDDDMPTKEGDVLAQILPSGPSHQTSNNLALYVALFYAAKKRISIVVPYFVPDESVVRAIHAAVKRGVKVTIINSEIIDKLLTGQAQRSYYSTMLDAGVDVYLYKAPIFLHNKQVLIDDDIAVVGSSNLDIRSFELDLELSVILYDKKIVEQLVVVEENYKRKSKKLYAPTWHERPLRTRLIERLARLTSALQ